MGKIQNALTEQKNASVAEVRAKQSINTMMNLVLDGEGMRKRFDELLGKKSPQFISSMISMVNDNDKLQTAFRDNPMSVIKAALRAATYDLPIDPTLGFAYVIPFYSNKNRKYEATFILGYKGMIQLCLRTGAYSRIPDAVDVREGELVSYDRLTGDAKFNWIDDDALREQLPVIGYAGYFRLKNGAEKTIYMTVDQIKAHEKKNRKGEYQNSLWSDSFDAMAKKTVIRRLISHFGLMSIDYQEGNEATVKLATAVAEDGNEDIPFEFTEGDVIDVDAETGEVLNNE